mgnify:CR=1 FL=1
MKTGNLELKAIKVLEGMSQETFCYSANLYWKGKKIGTVGNAGHGGCDDAYRADILDGDPHVQAWQEMEDWIATLPKRESEYGEFPQDLDSLCSKQVSHFLMGKDFKKMCRKWCVYFGDWAGSYYDYPKKFTREAIEKHVAEKGDMDFHFLNDATVDEYIKMEQARG